MNYLIGEVKEFEVIKDFGDNEDFFRLRLSDGGEVRLPKMKFQREEPLPDHIACRIKYVNNGIPVVAHSMPQYVNRFYRQGFTLRREYEFTVLELPAHAGDKYILEDKYGIRYNLVDDNVLLSVGQKVLCRFSRLTNTMFSIEVAGSDMRLPMYRPEIFLSQIGITGKMATKIVDLFDVHLPEAKAECDNDNPLWIVTALKLALERLSDWFCHSDVRRRGRSLNRILQVIEKSGLYLIENSRFLRNLTDSHRRSLQQIVTDVVDGLEPYRSTLDLIVKGGECEFVGDLIFKLKQSGYLYHPARQFSILMMIFRTDPQLVKEYLGKIFETIMEWKLETWTTEPFRSAFVGQFEIYIRQACREIDLLPQADTDADIERIENIVTAIALQMLISDDPDSARYRRNRSLFYRYISLLRPVKSDDLLDKAFLTLMGVNLPLEFNYDMIKEPLMLMTRATVKASEDSWQLQSIHTYREGDVQLIVDDNGISLSRADEDNPGRVIPNGMMEWLSPQVYLNGVQSLNGGQLKNIEQHKRLWNSIETTLFERRTHVLNQTRERRKAEIGDDVKIVIYEIESSRGDNPRWAAMIDDEQFISEGGYILRDDIVGFSLKSIDLDRDRLTARSAFVDENDRPRHFIAKVLDIAPDGTYHFSLLDDVAGQCGAILDYNTTFTAVIAQRHEYEYSAISDTGYGVYLQRDAQNSDYEAGNVVYFRVIDRSNPNHIVATIIDDADDGVVLNKVTAFSSLMKAICIVEDSDDESDSTMMLDADETLSREDVAEIIELIRFKAISSSALLAAYDYLQFGRILAILIGDPQLAKRIQVHADLLRLHQFYATNRRIDADELERFREEVTGYPMLEVVFHRLELVSWLGDADRNPDLWDTIAKGRNLLETNLARLVLSYNMLPDTIPGDSDSAVAEGLKSNIAHMLGVNFEARQLKSYGTENQFIEFKSSFVYPARKNKNDKMKANPEAQQFVLLKSIAGFLNASGGTLYIGVNDVTRCEAGLFEDFEFYKHHRASIGQNTYAMASVDNFIVFLTNLVRFTWGSVVAGSVEIEQDDEATRPVIVVKVQPRLTPVLLDGKIFVRRSSSTIQLNDVETKEFIEERKMQELRSREELRVAKAKSEQQNDAPAFTQAADKAVEKPAIVVENATNASPEPATDDSVVLATSQWRPNVLHNWEEGYIQPAGYLYIGDDNTLMRTDEDRSYDYNADCRLALCFTEREARQGMLVVVFDTRQVLKVPMNEILEKDLDRRIPFYKDARPVFAAIVLPTDAVMFYLYDNKGSLYRRVVPLSDIENAHLTSTPPTIADVPGVAGVTACEIVSAAALHIFAGSMECDMSTRQIGYTLRTTDGSEKAAQLLAHDCHKCSPTAHK